MTGLYINVFAFFSFIQESSPKDSDIIDVAFKVLSVVGVVLGALGGVIAYFLTRYWNVRDGKAERLEKERIRETEQLEKERTAVLKERANMRDILYESLQWFEGGTQKRSIGIAVVKTSWKTFEEFRSLWLEVLVNQSIYLLAAQDPPGKPHEHENLRRMMEIIIKEKILLDSESNKILCETLADKLQSRIEKGLELTPKLKKSLGNWQKELDLIKGSELPTSV